MRALILPVLVCCPLSVAMAQEGPLATHSTSAAPLASAPHKKPHKIHHAAAVDTGTGSEHTAADLPTASPRIHGPATAAGPSFGLRWHATSDAINPYEDVQHTAGPEGPGDAVEAGFKLGF